MVQHLHRTETNLQFFMLNANDIRRKLGSISTIITLILQMRKLRTERQKEMETGVKSWKPGQRVNSMVVGGLTNDALFKFFST